MISFEGLNDGLEYPNPDLGNSEYLDLRTAIRHNMASGPRTILKGSPVIRYRLSFTVLSGQIASTHARVAPGFFVRLLIDFIIANLDKVIKYTDHEGAIHNVKFTKETYEYVNSYREGSTFTIEMEKIS